jgi:hypothetical protein
VARSRGIDTAAVLFKDGKTFFRSAAEKHGFKSSDNYELSLKNYNSSEIQRIICLRPEEIFLRAVTRNQVQYYQPASERLDQGLVVYKYDNVEFDYSHIDENDGFKPENRESTKLFIWNDSDFHDGKFELKKGILVPRGHLKKPKTLFD